MDVPRSRSVSPLRNEAARLEARVSELKGTVHGLEVRVRELDEVCRSLLQGIDLLDRRVRRLQNVSDQVTSACSVLGHVLSSLATNLEQEQLPPARVER